MLLVTYIVALSSPAIGQVDETSYLLMEPPARLIFDFTVGGPFPPPPLDDREPAATFGTGFVVRGESIRLSGEDNVGLVNSFEEDFTAVGVQTLTNPVVLNQTYAVGDTEKTQLVSSLLGIDATVRTGRGNIAVLFDPPVCAFGLEIIQTDRLFSGFDHRRTALHLTFHARDGRKIDQVSRSPEFYHSHHAFERPDGTDPIAGVTVSADDIRGFAIRRIIAQPCSAEMS